MKIRKLVGKIKRKFLYGQKADSQTYIRYLRKLGMSIGENTVIFDPVRTLVDETRPWLIEIGNNVQITADVIILTHGYDWSVLKNVYGEVLGSGGRVHIGDNVFVGMRSTILKGVHIGNNVIIGANSLVNKDIPDNCVAVGNPCKVIMSLEEYYEKRKKAQLKEATETVQEYRKKYKQEANEYALREFFWLFSDNPDELPNSWKSVNALCGNEAFTVQQMRKHSKIFKDMGEFLNSIQWER